uniref:Uncharacterized protein n=1 Tax=Chromera velia CCMP2878 TaxID=1169474 RepID=A0A0G4HZQ7_9ALVE|eukprot:Cvel_9744.t1-p1 / transcript=Cvel_9744.t1 / gene=Cvel_9744 / organism=Chromera_velia_CCMP2878 / gene_product=hypothetical protein / transcript_product=hypothetical protein / location=Cvel_scaffold570:1498-2706(+) / protein_length=403 / sequence_SO=supercontig / SO=protein_coding / is_pseudo=false
MLIWERFGNFLSLVCELQKFKDIPSGEVQANGESLLKEGFEIAERLLKSTGASRPSGPPTGISEKQSAVQHATRHTDTGRPKTRRNRRLTEAAWKKKVAEQTQSQQSSEHCNAGCPKGSAGRGRKQKVQQPRDVFSEGMRKAPGAHGNANRSGERGKASRRGFGSNHSNSSGRSQQWRRPKRGTERERTIIPSGTPEKEFRVREGDVDWVEETLGDGGVRVRSHGCAQSGVSNQSQQQTDVQVSGVREGSVPVSSVGATLTKTPSMTFDFSQSSQKEGRGTWEVQEGSGIVNADGGVFFATPQTTNDFGQSSPVMAPAGGDGQINEPAPMDLCRIERSKKDEGGVGKDLFELLYGVGSWELREQIHCQSERPHSPSPQLNRLETGGQGNDFGGGSPGKAERQK